MRAIVSLPDTTMPTLVDVTDPRPQPGEVLVRVTAAAINPADGLVASGAAREAFGLTGQVGLGYDISGVVESVGTAVTGLAAGDRVAAVLPDLTLDLRGQAELAIVPADQVAAVPTELGLVAAGSVPLNALTADQALAALPTPSGRRRLLVTGAGGAVGGYAIDLAVDRGWTVDGLARSTDSDFVSATGAHLVTTVGAARYDAVLDAAFLADHAVAALRDGGTYVGLLGPWGDDVDDRVNRVYVNSQADGPRLAELLERSLKPSFAPRVAATYPLGEHVAAYEASAQAGLRGRVLLTP